MEISPIARTQIFLCYDSKDQIRKDELMEQLAYYQRHWSIDVWSNERISPGKDIQSEIADALAKARVAILLVSASLFASQWIIEYELPALLKAAETEGLRLLPILLSPCSYQSTSLGDLQFMNPPAQRRKAGQAPWIPLSRMDRHKRSELWVNVVEELQREMHTLAEQNNTQQVYEPVEPSVTEEGQRQADKSFAEEYRAALCGDPLLTKIQVLDMDHALTLEDIYVRVQVHHERRFRSSVESVEQDLRDPLNIFHSQQRYLAESKNAGMEPAVAVRNHPHCVVVGDPGAGKTTLLKYLALQCTSGKAGYVANCALFVSLHDFARKRQAESTLLEYILVEWERIYHLPRERAHDFLVSRLRVGRMLVLLDALDETMIGDESALAEQTYQAVHEAVSDFHRSYPRTPMVVTARKAAYHQHAHLVGFDLLEVVDFLPEQIEAFVKNWFQHDPHEERRGMGEGLLTRLKNNPRISALAANPLLLGLIAYTYEENNERLPANRADLYKLCIETLLRKWDDKRKIRRAHSAIDTYEQERLLPRLAWHFHVQGLRYFTRRELLKCIEGFAEALGRSTRAEDLQEILDEITSDNGLLREQAPGYYGFLHLTLQEYFTARHLSNVHGLELLLEHLGNPWWEEVILLYAGQTDDASDLLESLLSPGSSGEAPEDIFCNKLLLAGHCLAAQVQIMRRKQLRTTIPDLLWEKLQGPFTLLQRQAAEVLAEIGRAYPEHQVNERLFLLVEDRQTNEKLCAIVVNAISVAGGRRLQRRLISLLWLIDSPWLYFIYNKLETLAEQLHDKTIQLEAKQILSQKDLPPFVYRNVVGILCRCADTPTFEWLLAWLAKEDKSLLASAFSVLVSGQREDLALALPYVVSFFAEEAHLKEPSWSAVYRSGIRLLGKISSMDNFHLLEELVLHEGLDVNNRREALESLARWPYPERDDFVTRILTDVHEDERLRATAAQWFMHFLPAGEAVLRAVFHATEQSFYLRLTIAGRLIHKYPQEVIPVLWEIYRRQRIEPITQKTLYFCLQPLLLLFEQNEQEAVQEMFAVLEHSDDTVWFVPTLEDREADVLVFVPFYNHYVSMSRSIVRGVLALADPRTLNAFCLSRRIHACLRRDLIRQVVQAGKQADIDITALLTELADSTLEDTKHIALVEALGDVELDEQTLATFLNIYQEEANDVVRDAMYTALSKLARRANVTILPGESVNGELQVVRR